LNLDAFSPLFGIIQLFLVIILALIFTRYYTLDGDKRKLMFIIALLFVSPFYFSWINSDLTNNVVFEKFTSWAALPIVIAVLATSVSTVYKRIKVETIFKTFMLFVGFSVLCSIVSIFVDNNLNTILLSGISLVAIFFSIYSSLVTKELSNILFSVSLLSFMSAALMGSSNNNVGALFIAHAVAVLCIFLVFYTSRKSGKFISPFFSLQKRLDEAYELIKIQQEKMKIMGKLTRHDVRNKLSVVTGNVYLTKQLLPKDSAGEKYLSETESAVEQIEHIFDFARIYEQLGVEELSYVDVGKCFDGAVSLVSSQKEVTFVNEGRGLMVFADSLLSQLMFTMIDNSLRHGEKVSRIRIHHKAGDDVLKIVIEDDGVGISKEEKEIIFKEGYGKGSGLGLHLVKLMCEVYGWTIQETGTQGEGAQFTMTIPKTSKNGKTAYQLQ